MVNQQCGGAVVTPWNVNELPEVELDAFRILANEGQGRARVQQKVNGIKAAWLAKHPTYGK